MTVQRRRKGGSMKTSVIIAAAAALSATSPAYASRPATPAEARVFRDVAAYLHTPEPVVVVDDSIDSEDTWGNANGERIALSRLSAGEARIYARAVSKPTLKGRRRALSACYDVCQNAIRGALHESVHYSRWTLGLLDSATYDPVLKLYPREEGIAESVVGRGHLTLLLVDDPPGVLPRDPGELRDPEQRYAGLVRAPHDAGEFVMLAFVLRERPLPPRRLPRDGPFDRGLVRVPRVEFLGPPYPVRRHRSVLDMIPLRMLWTRSPLRGFRRPSPLLPAPARSPRLVEPAYHEGRVLSTPGFDESSGGLRIRPEPVDAGGEPDDDPDDEGGDRRQLVTPAGAAADLAEPFVVFGFRIRRRVRTRREPPLDRDEHRYESDSRRGRSKEGVDHGAGSGGMRSSPGGGGVGESAVVVPLTDPSAP